ncbi:MAG: carbohydrate ABC transporter permease [Streptosporangiales bacterium]
MTATVTPPATAGTRRRRGTRAPLSGGRSPARYAGSALVWLLVAFDISVLVFLALSSFKSTAAIFAAPWAPPTSPRFENWLHAWTGSGFGRATFNTAAVVAAGAVSTVAISAPAAYVLVRVRSRTTSFLTVFFAAGLGIPAQVTVIPLFVMVSAAGLVNNLFGLYVVYAATHLPFTVFLLTGFLRSLPSEMEEAAAIDGASPMRTFWQIMLPLARSGLITVLVLNAISMWNETLLALVFLQSDEKYTLSLALLNFLASMQYTGADYGALFAGVCILVLPMLLLYLWLGRRIIEGMTLGAGR